MIELTKEEVKDLFISYKNRYIGLEEAVDCIFLWQSENKIKEVKE